MKQIRREFINKHNFQSQSLSQSHPNSNLNLITNPSDLNLVLNRACMALLTSKWTLLTSKWTWVWPYKKFEFLLFLNKLDISSKVITNHVTYLHLKMHLITNFLYASNLPSRNTFLATPSYFHTRFLFVLFCFYLLVLQKKVHQKPFMILPQDSDLLGF